MSTWVCPRRPDQPASFSPRGTSSAVWWSGEQQRPAQVRGGGSVGEGGAGGAGRRSNCVACTEDRVPETDAAERRMGTAVGRSDVWFRFKEGVSNAVRRSLYVRDLL